MVCLYVSLSDTFLMDISFSMKGHNWYKRILIFKSIEINKFSFAKIKKKENKSATTNKNEPLSMIEIYTKGQLCKNNEKSLYSTGTAELSHFQSFFLFLNPFLRYVWKELFWPTEVVTYPWVQKYTRSRFFFF